MDKETNYHIILDIWNITKRLYDNPTFSDEGWEQLNNDLQDLNKKYHMQPYIRDLTLATVNEFERQQERRKIDNRV